MTYVPGNRYRELFTRHEANPILTYRDWSYAVNSVFNPGSTMVNGQLGAETPLYSDSRK